MTNDKEHEAEKSGEKIQSNQELSGDTKKGCVGTVALLTWFIPPLWPIAIATTWAMYPKTSKKVALGLGGALVVAIVVSMIESSRQQQPVLQPVLQPVQESVPDENLASTELATVAYSKDEADIKCRRAVKESLKDPGSMNIGWGDVESGTYAQNSSEWIVKFPFRARNSFNALTPGFAQCRVSKNTGLVLWSEVNNLD